MLKLTPEKGADLFFALAARLPTPQQRAVFALGERLRVGTLTANAAAVRAVGDEGVRLEVVTHRPVWLVGL